MLEIEKAIMGKTLEELKPKNNDVIYPKEHAPYAYKLFLEKYEATKKVNQ